MTKFIGIEIVPEYFEIACNHAEVAFQRLQDRVAHV